MAEPTAAFLTVAILVSARRIPGPPLAAYHLDAAGFSGYGSDAESSTDFVRGPLSEIASVVFSRFGQLAQFSLFDRIKFELGWSLFAGCTLLVFRWRGMSLEQVIFILAGLGFLAVQRLRYFSYEPLYVAKESKPSGGIHEYCSKLNRGVRIAASDPAENCI